MSFVQIIYSIIFFIIITFSYIVFKYRKEIAYWWKTHAL